MFSSRFPPRNRRPVTLPLLAIEIEHYHGVRTFDPNGLIMWALRETVESLTPISDRRSDISGEPAVLYRADDMEIALTPAELRAMIRHNLSPAQYFALRDKFGMAFEWHDDFYDEESGTAAQPV